MKRWAVIFLLAAVTLFPAGQAFAARSKLVIAIIPEQNLVRQMERFLPLCNYLEKKTGLEVDLKPLSNYGHIYEEMRDGNIDAGFFGSFVYTMTRARLGIEPIARPVRLDGGSTYTGLTFVRKDSNIRKVADMRGKTIALADPATTASYMAQKEYFKNNDLDIDKDLKIYWAGSHEAAIRAVLNNQAEIGGAKDTMVRKIRKENKVFDTVVTIIDENPKKKVPDNTFAVRKGLPAATKAKLKKALLEMNNDPAGKKVLEKFGATRFIETRDGDFQPLYELVRHLNIDLATYPYRKR